MNDAVEVETVFVVALRKDGTFFATTDINTSFSPARVATSLDVKHGCNDILDVMSSNDIATLLMAKLAANSQSESERTASSIRQALSDKGIL